MEKTREELAEELKRKLFMSGIDDIEEFVGFEISDDWEKDTIDRVMDQVIDEMSNDEIHNHIKTLT